MSDKGESDKAMQDFRADPKTINAGYLRIVYMFHIFILAPLFIYGAYFAVGDYESKALYTSLILYAGIFAILYHGFSLLYSKTTGNWNWNWGGKSPVGAKYEDIGNKAWLTKVYWLHLLMGLVFAWLGYQYWFHNRVPDNLLGTIGGFGIMALIYHGYAWLRSELTKDWTWTWTD